MIMKNFIEHLLKSLVSPVVWILQLFYQLLNSLIKLLIEVPISVIKTLTNRASNSTAKLDQTLDDKKQKDKANHELKQAQSAIKVLFRAEGILGYSRASTALKWVLILFLQAISFLTTYKGFDQFYSAFGVFVPLGLALVVQLSIFFLSGTVNSCYSHKGQKLLLVIALITSISFSYVGAAGVLMPYKNYLMDPYNQFFAAYSDILFEVADTHMTYSDPTAQLTGEYQKIEQFISSMEKQFDFRLLEDAENKLKEYQNRTIPSVTDNPIYYIYDNQGEPVPIGGGQNVDYVPDPAMKDLIEQQENYIEQIKNIQTQCQVVRNSMETFNLEYVLGIIQTQMKNDATMDHEFIILKSAIEFFQTQLYELAKLTKTDITFSLNLDSLVSEHNNYKTAESFKQMKSFAEITNQWQQENRQNNIFYLQDVQKETKDNSEQQAEENNFFQKVMQSITINNPNGLRELVLDHTADIYFSFKNTLKHSNLVISTDKLDRLEQTYQALSNVETPIVYSFSLFISFNTWNIALFIMAVAVFIDGFSVLIGLLMNKKRPNWLMINSTSTHDILPYAYIQFKMVIMTIIHKRLNTVDKVSIYTEFITILQTYIGKFEVFPGLHKQGYSGYMVTDGKNMDQDFKLFLNFAMNFGIVKVATERDCKMCGFVKPDHPQYILLMTTNGQLWLNDLMGNASEICIDMNCKSS